MPADPLIDTVKKAIRALGAEPFEVDFATAQTLKAEARQRDAALVASGTATPEDIQRKNTFIPHEGTEIEILDVRGSIARR